MLATRHRDERVTAPAPRAGLVIRLAHDAAEMASVQGRELPEMDRRMNEGHRAYVAEQDGVVAAWGWVATSTANIGELGATFTLPRGQVYLWNFVTRPEYRGMGIYPRLLHAIMQAEDAERFWIAYAPENHASGAGIEKAGFTVVAALSFDDSGAPAVRSVTPGGGALAAAMLGIAEAHDALAPCWKCVRAGRTGMSCRSGSCACDYQKPAQAC